MENKFISNLLRNSTTGIDIKNILRASNKTLETLEYRDVINYYSNFDGIAFMTSEQIIDLDKMFGVKVDSINHLEVEVREFLERNGIDFSKYSSGLISPMIVNCNSIEDIERVFRGIDIYGEA